MEKLHQSYYVFISLAFVMAVVMWGAAQPHLTDFWRWMFFICADILLFVIIIGTYFTSKNLKK